MKNLILVSLTLILLSGSAFAAETSDLTAAAIDALPENVAGFVNFVSGTVETLKQMSEFEKSVNLTDDVVASFDFAVLRDFVPVTINAGTEYKPLENVSVKVGLNSNPLSGESSFTNLKAGVGVNYAGFNFEYSYNSNSNPSEFSGHCVTISLLPEA